MQNLKVEYLIIFRNEDAICKGRVSFNNLITANSDFTIKRQKLKYKKKIEVKYEISDGDIEDRNQRYFNVKFTSDLNKVDNFIFLLKNFRTMVSKVGAELNVIWDDISFFYCVKAYPLIYEIENLMRKLINKFMLMNVGIEWVDESLPDELKDVIIRKAKEKKSHINVLNQTDFIHLADLLFKPYQKVKIQTIYDEILKLKNDKDEIKKLKNYVPKSNWNKYFSKLLDCEAQQLEKKWIRLYELRCLIAHNNYMTTLDFEETIQLYNELKIILSKSIKTLDKIKVTQKDKQQILEIVNNSDDSDFERYFHEWRNLRIRVRWYVLKKNLIDSTTVHNLSFLQLFSQLNVKNLLPLNIIQYIWILIDFFEDFKADPKNKLLIAKIPNNVNLIDYVINFLTEKANSKQN